MRLFVVMAIFVMGWLMVLFVLSVVHIILILMLIPMLWHPCVASNMKSECVFIIIIVVVVVNKVLISYRNMGWMDFLPLWFVMR